MEGAAVGESECIQAELEAQGTLDGMPLYIPISHLLSHADDRTVERNERPSPAPQTQSAQDRRSSILEAADLLAFFIAASQRTIAFCRVRKLVELVYKYCHSGKTGYLHQC